MTRVPIGAVLLFVLPLACADVRQLNIDSFEQVWTAVRDRHWDPKLGGLDWQKVHDELRPRIEKAATVEESRAVLSEMLKRLGHSHLGIIPAETYGQMDSAGHSREGVTGIEVRAIGGAALVVSVQSGSPAAAAGVRPGWEIRKIDGKEIPPALAQAPAALRGKTWEPAYLAALVMNRLSGPPATSVDVEFRQDGGRTASLAIGRARPRGILGHLGFLPPFYVWTETRRLPGDVGYFAFNAFSTP